MATKYDATISDNPEHAVSPRLLRAIDEAQTFQSQTISITQKAKALRKFGKRASLSTTTETLAALGGEADETYLSTNGITHLISSSTGDTEDVIVEYHTINGASTQLTFGVQTVTLTGQTAAALPTACARVSRMYNNSGTELAGDVYAYEGGATSGGVPTDLTTVHAQIVAGEQQTQKLATSISNVDAFFITEVVFSVLSGNNLEADFTLETKKLGGVWLPKFEWAAAVQGSTSVHIPVDPVIYVPNNSDIRVRAAMVSGTANVSGQFAGYLGSII